MCGDVGTRRRDRQKRVGRPRCQSIIPAMEATVPSPVIAAKTRELCLVIAEQPEFAGIRTRIEQFSGDTEARMQFELVNRKGAMLEQKQQEGQELTPAEIGEFEQLREALLANDVARGFLEAREQMVALQEAIQQQIGKTFELGRAPTPEESAGQCGSGCGCH